jgi:hypothetical protein
VWSALLFIHQLDKTNRKDSFANAIELMPPPPAIVLDQQQDLLVLDQQQYTDDVYRVP